MAEHQDTTAPTTQRRSCAHWVGAVVVVAVMYMLSVPFLSAYLYAQQTKRYRHAPVSAPSWFRAYARPYDALVRVPIIQRTLAPYEVYWARKYGIY